MRKASRLETTPKTKYPVTSYYASKEYRIYTYCREIFYGNVKAIFDSAKNPVIRPEVHLTGAGANYIAQTKIIEFIQLLDALVGVTAVALAPLDTLNLDGYEPGSYKVESGVKTLESYHAGEAITYHGIPYQLFLFDPIITSILQGLIKTSINTVIYELDRRILDLIDQSHVIDIIKNKQRNAAIELTIELFGILNQIRLDTDSKTHHGSKNIVYPELCVGPRRNDAISVIKVRKYLRDLEVKDTMHRWSKLNRVEPNKGYVIYHGWKKERCPNIWTKEAEKKIIDAPKW